VPWPRRDRPPALNGFAARNDENGSFLDGLAAMPLTDPTVIGRHEDQPIFRRVTGPRADRVEDLAYLRVDHLHGAHVLENHRGIARDVALVVDLVEMNKHHVRRLRF
jgi:hypothetical protein